jgi:Sec-independent protein secretion pathway component TatC
MDFSEVLFACGLYFFSNCCFPLAFEYIQKIPHTFKRPSKDFISLALYNSALFALPLQLLQNFRNYGY